jgi:LPS O-antigen subunit length determinant protein (WzzB/FepE family)
MVDRPTPTAEPQERPHPRYTREPGYYPEDEISLIDLWNVLIRRKLLILAITILAMMAATCTAWSPRPSMKAKLWFSWARRLPPVRLENPDEMVQRLRQAYRVGDDTEGPREMPFVEAISLNKREADHVVTLTARAEAPQQAGQFLQSVVDGLLEEHRVRFEQAAALIKSHLDSLTSQTEAFQSQIALIQAEMDQVREVNPVQASVLAVESGKLMAQLPGLEQRRNQLQLDLLDSRSYASQLLRSPTVAAKPVQPRPKLYIAIALVLGVMLGVFAAFFAEFLNNARREPS